jgi:hypothetical protein
MLFAAGELDGLAAAGFEAQLATDPAAQEALIQAVALHELLTGPPRPPRKDYRAVVRQQVTARRSWWNRLAGRRISTGHPAAWGLLGAAAAALLFLVLPSGAPDLPPPVDSASLPVVGVVAVPPEPAVVGEEETTVVIAVPEPESATDNPAEVWADLTNMDHLQRAHEEHMRRRTRSTERPGSSLTNPQRSRPLHNMQSPRR